VAPNDTTPGAHSVTPYGVSSNNYAIQFVAGTLTVTPRQTGGYLPQGQACEGAPGHEMLPPISRTNNPFKQGSTVPAKFRVCYADHKSVGTPGVVRAFTLVQIVDGTSVTNVNEPVALRTPNTSFRWDATDRLWIANIDTKPLKAGRTYVYRVELNDGSAITFAIPLK
jgi:hypothetical protein